MIPAARRSATVLHQELVRSIVEVEPATVPLRRASMCHDGTPLVHSLKLARDARPPAFRLLVEPGGVGISVPGQIDFSLRVLDGLLGQLGWRSAVADLNQLITAVLPAAAAAVTGWWGGIWLGMAAGQEQVDLRVYLNLRHGEALSRWQRVARALGRFSDAALEPLFREWVDQVAPHAVPVGMGIVVVEGRVGGLRIYTGLHQPSPDVLRAVRVDGSDGACPADVALDYISNAFTGSFGPFAPQSVTVGYDFRLSAAQLLEPQIARTKVDFSCQPLPPESRAHLPAFISGLAADLGYDSGPLATFLADIDTCFGGCRIEFLSAGFAGRLEHVTVYTRPHGYAGR